LARAAKTSGSKAKLLLCLVDRSGPLLASSDGCDGAEPLLNFQIPASARYRVRIADKTDAGSREHFYRLAVGAFPVVVGCFPLGVPANKETSLVLIGFNLPPSSSALVKAASSDQLAVPIDPEIHRSRQ